MTNLKRLLILFALLVLVFPAFAAEPPEIRVGVSLDFRPYDFPDKDGPTGFTVDLIKAVADRMGLRLHMTTGPWDKLWDGLVAGQLDVLPTVTRTPGREALVDFSLPHTQTFDAFFVREGRAPIKDLADATGKEIVVARSDAAHHELIEHKFNGKVILVDSIPDGLRLIAAGKYDAFLCSRLVGVLEGEQAGIKGITAGPPIPDYKREFSFAVRKGNAELVEKLNQGLLMVKADGTYDRLYRKWLGMEKAPAPKWQEYFWPVVAVIAVLSLLVIIWRTSREEAKWDDVMLRALAPQRLWALPPFWRYTLALLVVTAVMAVRWTLIPWLGTAAPYSFATLTIVGVTVLLGAGPGLLTMLWGDVAAEIFIVGSSPASFTHTTMARLSMQVAIGTVICGTLHGLRVAAIKARQAAQALRKSEALLQAVLDNSPDPLFLKDREGRLQLANPAFFDVIGKPPESCLGKTDPEFLDDSATGRPIMETDRHIMESGRLEILEESVPRMGEQRIFLSTKAPFRDAEGRVIGIIGIAHEITERKRAEEALRELNAELEQKVAERTAELTKTGEKVRAERQRFLDMLDTLPVIIDIIRPDGHIEWANRAYRDALGDNVGRLCYESQFGRNKFCDECQAFTPLHTGQPHHWEWTLPNSRTFDIYNFPFASEDGSPAILEMDIDITDIRKAQAAVQAERQRLYDVLETVPAMVCLLTPDYRVAFANRSFREKFGDSNGRHCYENCFGRNEPCDFCESYKVLETGKPHHWEVTGPDGSVIDAYDFPFTDVDGSPMILEMDIDITAHRQTEKALKQLNETLEQRVAERTLELQENKELLALFVENAPAALAMFDREMRYLSVSRRWLIDYGLGERNLLGLSHYEVFPEIPDRWREVHRRGLAGEIVRQDNDRFERVDGSVQWLRWEVRPWRTAAGEVGGVIVFTEDITERKRAEEELHRLNKALKALSDSSQATIRAEDEQSYLEEVCRIIMQDCGYAMVWIGFAENDEAKSVRPVAHAGFEEGYLETLELTWDDTKRGRGPTGTAIRTGKVAVCRNMLTDPTFAPWREQARQRGYASSIVFPLHSLNKVFGAITIYSKEADPFSEAEVKLLTELADDLSYGIEALRTRSARMKAEEELHKLTEELKRSNADLQQFAYAASHDLQEPLRGIAGFARLLEKRYKGKLDEKADEFMDYIIGDAKRMQELIKDLLEYSRIETKIKVMKLINCSVVLEEAFYNLRSAVEETGTELTYDHLPTVMADASQLKSLFQNLIGNAIKFHAKEKPRIHISVEQRGDEWVFSVKDNGIGFESELTERIFVVFQRLHTRKEYPGTGIGLAICKKIVERHGGRIWAKSEPGNGSTFYFTLPIRNELGSTVER